MAYTRFQIGDVVTCFRADDYSQLDLNTTYTVNLCGYGLICITLPGGEEVWCDESLFTLHERHGILSTHERHGNPPTSALETPKPVRKDIFSGDYGRLKVEHVPTDTNVFLSVIGSHSLDISELKDLISNLTQIADFLEDSHK